MRVFRTMGALLCIAFATGCATTYDVTYDYDQQTDFHQFKTYDWMPAPGNAMVNELVLAGVKNATDFELEAKGLVKAPAAPDFHVVPHVSATEKIDVANWGYGYGPRSNYLGSYWGTGGVPAYSFKEGVLALDFVDAKTNHLVWRGSTKADIDYLNSTEDRWEAIKKAVREIMRKYPPPPK